ncbi:MAG: 30S ribosomal protein S8 [Syntrophotalea acetylenica]|jgi:small subunit ribosomal protein S8|uniref:Small ribosomal subunit protein uS8 n=1 Tax=Syntrophotalea acetylenica TaxID=29542 RepID=A0A1L3GE06_SYNAC|nr:30S ribosomal protein S8 [Syntrophotalea acetylenica]APG24181.1 30S ribosomal protein S8 [Syntrophotalea acetylenica]APG44762.1 30S ribosomal protein S8 [Syntrophotalea acetylenica]MDD4456226.1 30S ribosomal protein S8 [Syntrophotalea acetylenica]MDY0261859.1 30S ribosomal protein S8 [Syntrophotalea acetylenica]
MAMTDPIADMLTRIRNAGLARHAKCDVPASNVKLAIVTVLKELGYIKNFKQITDEKQGVLRIYLKFDNDSKHIINAIDRVSTPGRRVYVGKDEIPVVKNGLGNAILSTSKGVMHDVAAREAQLGGEVLCSIW